MRRVLIFCLLAALCVVPVLGAELEVPGLDQVWEEAEGYGVAREGSLDAGLSSLFAGALGQIGGLLRDSLSTAAKLVAVVLLILYCTRTRSGRAFMRSLGYRLAFIRPVYEEIAACRFASGMALTLSSGLNPERSMELVSALNDDPLYQEKLESCRKKMDEGQDLSEALHETGMFTGIYARMASIGSRTGSMDQVMDRIAGLYQDEIDNRMNTALAVLEPTLVIALSLIVGVILLSVMLPLMGIMSSL